MLDVAGGAHGAVAFELQCMHGIPATLLEPRAVHLTGRQRSRLRKQPQGALGAFTHVRGVLDSAFADSDEGAALITGCALLVGMHPDEATEPIVDAAIRHGKPFAVLPCCVFPTAFPFRRLASGKPVTTYADFLVYLRDKDPHTIELGRLPVEGRNCVVFRRARPGTTATVPAQPHGTFQECGLAFVAVTDSALPQRPEWPIAQALFYGGGHRGEGWACPSRPVPPLDERKREKL